MHKNCCQQSCSFWLRYAPNRLSAGASPQTPLRELAALPRPPSWFRAGAPGERGGTGGGIGGKGGEGEEGMGREGRESRNIQIESWQAYAYTQVVICKTVLHIAHFGIYRTVLRITHVVIRRTILRIASANYITEVHKRQCDMMT